MNPTVLVMTIDSVILGAICVIVGMVIYRAFWRS